MSLLTEGDMRTFATAAILLELIESGSDHLMRTQRQRWSVFFNKIASTVISSLQADVDKSEVRKNAGEDIIVSSLRHAISRHSPTATTM
ncbi:unnamed protein product [Strongylus vulgaris]|uniref:Uncharacterized protein n=1 Tax=Strongylus vulgaris TaxID=40348 RepID=A0A3P7J0N2_STRVU|nr:unnamed protein product [Strongylus vulgaris]